MQYTQYVRYVQDRTGLTPPRQQYAHLRTRRRPKYGSKPSPAAGRKNGPSNLWGGHGMRGQEDYSLKGRIICCNLYTVTTDDVPKTVTRTPKSAKN